MLKENSIKQNKNNKYTAIKEINCNNMSTPLQGKTAVLYVLEDDEKSKRALAFAQHIPDLYVQYVGLLSPEQVPKWLQEVPTCVTLSDRQIKAGTKALEFLSQMLTIRQQQYQQQMAVQQQAAVQQIGQQPMMQQQYQPYPQQQQMAVYQHPQQQMALQQQQQQPQLQQLSGRSMGSFPPNPNFMQGPGGPLPRPPPQNMQGNMQMQGNVQDNMNRLMQMSGQQMGGRGLQPQQQLLQQQQMMPGGAGEFETMKSSLQPATGTGQHGCSLDMAFQSSENEIVDERFVQGGKVQENDVSTYLRLRDASGKIHTKNGPPAMLQQ